MLEGSSFRLSRGKRVANRHNIYLLLKRSATSVDCGLGTLVTAQLVADKQQACIMNVQIIDPSIGSDFKQVRTRCVTIDDLRRASHYIYQSRGVDIVSPLQGKVKT